MSDYVEQSRGWNELKQEGKVGGRKGCPFTAAILLTIVVGILGGVVRLLA